jgi:hypothetical protein
MQLSENARQRAACIENDSSKLSQVLLAAILRRRRVLEARSTTTFIWCRSMLLLLLLLLSRLDPPLCKGSTVFIEKQLLKNNWLSRHVEYKIS